MNKKFFAAMVIGAVASMAVSGMAMADDLLPGGGSKVIYCITPSTSNPYFKTVQQSSICYVRKPGPAIFYYAIEEVGIPAENSAFLGDNLDRDIVGAKAVNMGMTIAAKWGEKKYKLNSENRPDCVIFSFPQLLDLFPEAGKVNTDAMIPPEEAWKG